MTEAPTGVVAAVLTELFGPPTRETDQPEDWYVWAANEPGRSRLYSATADVPEELRACYGTTGGGFLIGSSLKMAVADGRDAYGLYTLNELAAQPELADLRADRPTARFFLDAANVWFYGVDQGELIAFDADLDELTELGDPATALRDLVAEWLDTSRVE